MILLLITEVFHSIKSVVVDIELALAAGYKKPQVFKLYKRQTSSLVQLGRFRDAYKG